METPAEYDDIRCYEAKDLKPTFDVLLADEQFCGILQQLFPNTSFEQLKAGLYSCKDVLDFQEKFVYAYIDDLMSKVSLGYDLDCGEIEDKHKAYTFISNHRDIVLDPGLLAMLLIKNGFSTTQEIAIGDNLLIFPWIKHLVRLNKAFIVQRSLGLREMLAASKKMSRYMHFVIREKQNPIWIAQREGRAKDSNDHTAEAVLKMVAMGGTGTPLGNLKEMNIVPMSLSYEYDPCDYLKAQEFQLKRDNADFKKSRQDDLLNMQTGILGFKGHVHFVMGMPINDWLDELEDAPKGQFFGEIAQRMDREIYRNYRLYPGNYVAADLLRGNSDHATHYSADEKTHFEKYLKGQLTKIDIPNKDEAFLRDRILEMYANPVFNHESVL
jgi:acyltransferase family protein